MTSQVDQTSQGRLWVFLVSLSVFFCFTVTGHSPNSTDAGFALLFALLFCVMPKANRVLLSTRVLFRAFLFCIITAALSLSSIHPWISFLSLPLIIGPMLGFLCAHACRVDRGPIVMALAAGGCINAAIAIFQKWYLWPELLTRADPAKMDAGALAFLQMSRAIGLSLSPDLCGALCLVGLFSSAALLARHEERLPQAVFTLGCLICIVGILSTRSAGTALCLGLWCFFLLYRALQKWRVMALLISSGGALLAFSFFRRSWISAWTSIHERYLNWVTCVDLWSDTPFTGVGLNRFAFVYAQARPPEANITRYAHHWFFHWLVEYGLLGALMVILLSGLGAWFLFQYDRKERSWTDFTFTTGIGCVSLRLFFDYDAQIGQTAILLMVLWGLLGPRSPAAKASPPNAHYSFAGLTILLTIALAGGNWLRSDRLSPFEKGAGPQAQNDAQKLEEYSERFPGDVMAIHITAQIKLGAILPCTEQCEAQDKVFLEWFQPHVDQPHGLARNHVLLAILAQRRGHDEQAMHHLRDALAIQPDERDAHYYRFLWTKQKTPKEASIFLQDSLQWHPSAVFEKALKQAP